VSLDQGWVHVQRSSAVLRDSVPVLHLEVAERPIREVGGLVGVFDLKHGYKSDKESRRTAEDNLRSPLCSS